MSFIHLCKTLILAPRRVSADSVIAHKDALAGATVKAFENYPRLQESGRFKLVMAAMPTQAGRIGPEMRISRAEQVAASQLLK